MSKRTNPAQNAAELRSLREKASMLIAASFITLALLVSACLPQGLLGTVEALSAPMFPQKTASAEHSDTPSASEQPAVTVRLADVDADIAPEVAARLVGVTAEVLDKNGGFDLKAAGPRVLIYHTHDTEAYTQTERYTYVPSGDWRTEDQSRSVVAVGEELARILREDYGISVIHDATPHEPPLITTAYTRSLETMERYKQQYPTLEMFIDLHRDGVGADRGAGDDGIGHQHDGNHHHGQRSAQQHGGELFGHHGLLASSKSFHRSKLLLSDRFRIRYQESP